MTCYLIKCITYQLLNSILVSWISGPFVDREFLKHVLTRIAVAMTEHDVGIVKEEKENILSYQWPGGLVYMSTVSLALQSSPTGGMGHGGQDRMR